MWLFTRFIVRKHKRVGNLSVYGGLDALLNGLVRLNQ